jgi:hypothetical protein
MKENEMIFGEEYYNKVLEKLTSKLKENFLIEGLDSEKLPILKNPKEFKTGKDTIIENKKYIITIKEVNNKKYFMVIRSSGKYFGEDTSKKTIVDIDKAVPYEISNNNICIGYFLTDQNKGYYTGSEKLAEKFSEIELKKEFIPTNKKSIEFDTFINYLQQIQKRYHIEIETITEAQNVGYGEPKITFLSPDELCKYPNKLVIKSLSLKEETFFYPKAFLKMTLSLSKLSKDKKSYIKIARLTCSQGNHLFKEFYTTIKEYAYISVNTTEKEKLEYFLIKRKILKNSIDDEEFENKIKKLGIASEKGRYIIFKVNLNELKERIKGALPDLNVSNPFELDTRGLLFYNKKSEIKKLRGGALFRIRTTENKTVNLLLLNDYEIKGLKRVLEEPLINISLKDPEKSIIIARSSYLFPFIIVDFKGLHIKYFRSSTPQTPFLLAAPDFLSDIEGTLKNALKSISEENYLNDTTKEDLADILYEFFRQYKDVWKSGNKRIGTYMERVFYAFLSTIKGEKELLGGKNEPDAKLEDKENKILYLFDTKNLKSSSLIGNIKERKSSGKYKFTCERYVSKYLKEHPNNEWEKIRFIYVTNEKVGSEAELIREMNDRFKEISRKYQKDVKAKIITFEEIYKRVKERKAEIFEE